MTPQGHCDSRFAPLAEAFARLFDNPQERGAALCLEVGGETVVDLWGGVADKDGEQPWQRDTILNLFSCTKTFTAVAVLQLVAEGKLELDAPVARTGPSSPRPARQRSACASCSAIAPACRRCASRCRPRHSTTGRR